jgi:hypothetical protein
VKLKAQESSKNINFIVSIDERIPTGSISNFQIIATSKNDEEKVIRANYYPGNISMSDADYKLLVSEDIKDIFLSFQYTEWLNKGDRKDYDYKIDIKKGWLTHYYYILYIYNTDKAKYKRMYDPIKGETFTYEFDSPNGSIRRVSKLKRTD